MKMEKVYKLRVDWRGKCMFVRYLKLIFNVNILKETEASFFYSVQTFIVKELYIHQINTVTGYCMFRRWK